MISPFPWRFAKPSPDVRELDALESGWSVRLPSEYRAIVLEHNGAALVDICFDVVGRREAVFSWLLAVGAEHTQNVLEANEALKSQCTERIYAFGEDPFGNLICFDYRDVSENPAVVFWDHELEGNSAIAFVANLFDEFLQTLRPFPD